MFEAFVAGFNWAATWCAWLAGVSISVFLLLLMVAVVSGLIGAILIALGFKKLNEADKSQTVPDKVDGNK